MLYNYQCENKLDDLPEVVHRVSFGLQARRAEFDSIAVRGISGLLVGAPVSLATGIPLAVVRKAGESQHAPQGIVNRDHMGNRVVFLDDFRSSGKTEDAVRSQVESEGGRIVLCYFYQAGTYAEPWAEPRSSQELPVESGLQLLPGSPLFSIGPVGGMQITGLTS